ncbi:hypothetical protein XELAEV_18029258mg [Xenopus laevis]|uniref:Laminin subunit alpha-4 n=1 Tax=Xenopus laevis TaxID=8355 RepID=A0A974CT20_XENLA|nr:hypothetical protein XELAEV_18029258mg [Xenopus laevis]
MGHFSRGYLICLIMSLWRNLCHCSGSIEGSAFHLDSEGSTSNPSDQDSGMVQLQHVVIPARLVPLAQRCHLGFYYSVSGECLPCNCNGNSLKCLDGSGECLDCQRNTTGKHCERCPPGYLGNMVRGIPKSCLPCSCPLPFSPNNFALACGVKSGSMHCICKDNYAGPNCERCAPGYYGNPLLKGSTCKKCDCSGNSDPNLIFEDCNELTGQCNNCMRNTTGFNCELCAPGYYGDARVAKNCKECRCLKCGTERCNDVTGTCQCKPGVTGVFCDRCETGHYGYSSCLGCQKCMCSLASLDNNCDPETLQCNCKAGAGGLKCERCKPGYWNYRPSGCQKCDCGGGPCNNITGECLLEDPESLANSDCSFDCDKCIWDLIDDLKIAASLADETKITALSISTGVMAHKHLNYINSTLIHLTEMLEEKNNQSVFTDLITENAESKAEALQTNVNKLADKGNLAEMKESRFHKETMETMKRAKLTAGQVNDIEDGIQELLGKLEYCESLHGDMSKADRVTTLKQAEQILKDMADLNFMRTEILYEWQQVQNNTQSLLPNVNEKIAEYDNELADLYEAMEEARQHINQTKEKNMANIGKLQMSNIQTVKLNKEVENVSGSLTQSNITLSGTHKLISNISDITKNMTGHHAEVDGAYTGLKERLANLSRNVENIVEEAVNHSLTLQREANGLSSNLKGIDANGFVQKAIDASNVHESIVNIIEAANETSFIALGTAESVNDASDGMDNQIKYQMTENEKLWFQAKELKEASDSSKDLRISETKQRVNAAALKNDALSDRLENAISQIEVHEDENTRKRLKKSKLVAEEALNITAMITKVTNPMSKNAKIWTKEFSNTDFDASAYNKVVNSAGEAVRNLTEVVPLLLNKLHTVEYKWPTNNISSSILRIRELIAQTRSVASKVQVSMKFGGKSAVDVSLKTNVADLKAYSSISLFLNPVAHQEKPHDKFIMYFGNKNATSDYMGLAIKSNNLVYVYNLGSGDVEIPLDSKPVNSWPGYFSLIKIERLGRHGKVLLTVPSPSSTAEEKFIKKGEATGKDSVLDLDPTSMVFYLGGVPPGFQLPASLNLPGFVGCLELATVNDEVVSLYNFKNIYNLNTLTAPPCARNKLAFTQSRATSYFFDGTGYAVIRNIERRGRFTQVTRFDVEVRTPVDNALILLMVNGTKFFSLELQDGYLRLQYDFGFVRGPVLLEDSAKKFQINDARYHEISVIYHNSKKMILVVDRRHVKSVDNEKTTIPFSDIYIGGAPSPILQSVKSHIAADISYKGCIKGFQFQKKDFNLLEEPETLGISYGCPEESLMSRRAYFNGQSFIASSQKLSPFDSFEGGFSFKTLQPSGLLLYHSEGADVFSVSMDKGSVVLRIKDIEVQSKNRKYSDGQNHFVVASVSPTRYQLLVDETDASVQDRQKSESSSPVARKFYFGGTPNGVSWANFTGCISNAYFTRVDKDVEVEDFQKYTEKVQSSLYGCPVESPPIALYQKNGKNSKKDKGKLKKSVGMEKKLASEAAKWSKEKEEDSEELSQCSLSSRPKAGRQAHLYGGIANSRQEFNQIPNGFNEKSELFSHGRLTFMFNHGQQKIRITSQEKYNDGLWHSVLCIREKNKGRLIINGLRVLEDSISAADVMWTINSAYSFSGCLSNLQMNGRSLTSPSQTFSVTPCFEGPMESGTYISSEGGYVILDDSFSTGLTFEFALEVRPRNNTGILIHFQNVNGEYLNLHMKQGQVGKI